MSETCETNFKAGVPVFEINNWFVVFFLRIGAIIGGAECT